MAVTTKRRPGTPANLNESDLLGADRCCDVILKGGVTSGVVYPHAITKLASRYVFRKIGGTSVGAIAAALTAAAEYNRRANASAAGFAVLQELPSFLSGQKNGQSNLLRQFWADNSEMRWQLDAALKLVGTSPQWQRLSRFIVWLSWRYCPVWLLNAAALLWLTNPSAADATRWYRIALAVVLGLIANIGLLLIVYVWRVWDRLRTNDFGWCHGHDPANDGAPAPANAPLVDWMADAIDSAAGLPLRTKPLTWGMLRGCTVAFGPTDDDVPIDVAMMTTCLTLQQSFSLPFLPGTEPQRYEGSPSTYQPPFWWKKAEFDKFFPAYVIEHLKRVAAESRRVEEGSRVQEYYRFPLADDLPLCVAARMSLSFPVLLCAVPLHVLQRGAEGNRFSSVWFSDGGLTSNLPIHFFDNPLPRWPTFAFDLLGIDPGSSGEPTPFIESTIPATNVDPAERLESRGHLDPLQLFMSIIDTTQTWRDRVLARLPGYADRTVGIRLKPDEGGLNLNMTADLIERLSGYGTDAASLLLRVFATGEGDSPGWEGHRWTRFVAVMNAFQQWKRGFENGFQPYAPAPWQTPYAKMIESAVNVPPGAPTASPAKSKAQPYPSIADAMAALHAARAIAPEVEVIGVAPSAAPFPVADLGPKPPY